MNAYIRFKHPFTCIVSWPTGSGKTSFCLKLLQKLDSLCTESKFKGGIIWCYSQVTAVPREKLSKLGRSIQYQEGLPENFGNAQGEPSVTLILFTATTEISAYYSWPNFFFHQGTHCIYISLNAKYLVLLKNGRDKNQVLYLTREAYPENSHSLYEAHLDATRQPHGYFILDFAQDTDDN